MADVTLGLYWSPLTAAVMAIVILVNAYVWYFQPFEAESR